MLRSMLDWHCQVSCAARKRIELRLTLLRIITYEISTESRMPQSAGGHGSHSGSLGVGNWRGFPGQGARKKQHTFRCRFHATRATGQRRRAECGGWGSCCRELCREGSEGACVCCHGSTCIFRPRTGLKPRRICLFSGACPPLPNCRSARNPIRAHPPSTHN